MQTNRLIYVLPRKGETGAAVPMTIENTVTTIPIEKVLGQSLVKIYWQRRRQNGDSD